MLETDFNEEIQTRRIVICQNDQKKDEEDEEKEKEHFTDNNNDQAGVYRSKATSLLREEKSEATDEKHRSRSLRDLVLADVCFQTTGSTPKASVPSTAKLRRWLPASLAADFLFAQLLLGPLITACWRGAWLTFNLFLDGDDGVPSWRVALGCVCAGFLLTNALAQTRPLWGAVPEGAEAKKGHRLRFFLKSRCYTVVSFFSTMVLWKGGWDVWSLASEDHAVTGACGLTAGIVLLTGLRRVRAGVGFALAFTVDEAATYFRIGFEDERPRVRLLQTLAFNLAEIAMISCWFGVWSLEDRLLGHQQQEQEQRGHKDLLQDTDQVHRKTLESAIASLALGLASALLVFLSQFPLLLLWHHLPSSWHASAGALTSVVTNVSVAAVGLLAAVSNLRGVWLLLDLHFFPGLRLASLLSSFPLPFAMLICLWCASSLHAHVEPDPTVHEVREGRSGFLLRGFYFSRWLASSADGHIRYAVDTGEEDGKVKTGLKG